MRLSRVAAAACLFFSVLTAPAMAVECSERKYRNAEVFFEKAARQEVGLVVIFRHNERATVYYCDVSPSTGAFSTKGKFVFLDSDNVDYWAEFSSTFNRDGSGAKTEVLSASLNLYGELLKKMAAAVIIGGIAEGLSSTSSSSTPPPPAPRPAIQESGWKLCNSTPASVSVVIAYETSTEFVRQGWWVLENGQCKTLLTNVAGKKVYFYAEGSGLVWGGSDVNTKYCISRTAFKFAGKQECESSNLKSFSAVQIDSTGSKTTNFVLNP